MVDTFTATTSNASVLLETALDLKVRYFLRQMPQFRQHVDVRPIDPAHDGSSVTLTVHGELAEATTPISETTDVDARDVPSTRQVTVSMDEYGATNIRSLRLDKVDWSNEIASTIAFQLADNMMTSMDILARTELDSATNVWFDDDGVGLVDTMPADGDLANMTATPIAAAVAALRSRRAIPRDGSHYICIMHPHVAHDVRREAGANTWSDPHINVNTGQIYAGETGTYAGARIIEHNRAEIATSQGTNSQTHYTTYFLAREALLEAVLVEPHAVVGPITDKLKRFYPLGWHGFLGWEIFRQNAIQLVKTESSLADLVDLSSYDPKA